jgi:hypothetical protein
MKPATLAVIAISVATMMVGVDAAVKVRTQFDKKFDYAKLRTWAWNDAGPGQVIMARTADDNPEIVRERAEPVIKEAVAAELPGRGVQAAPSGTPPDMELSYYLLITVGTQTQQIGQFLPAVAEWGLPPFTGATQSYNVIEQGSLVFDVSANDKVVWRGIGQAQIKPGQPQDKRRELLREAVRDILKKFPPKK